MKSLTLQGQQFGNWTVLKKSERKGRKKYWLCQCACGRIKSIRADGLVNGSSTQCQNCARRMHVNGRDVVRGSGTGNPE